MNQPTFVCNDLTAQLPELAADTIISRTIYRDEQLRTILFAFAAGQELSEHATPFMAVLHFLEGEARLTLGEEAIDVKAGSWIHMTPNLKHSVYAKTTMQMLLLMIKETV